MLEEREKKRYGNHQLVYKGIDGENNKNERLTNTQINPIGGIQVKLSLFKVGLIWLLKLPNLYELVPSYPNYKIIV